MNLSDTVRDLIPAKARQVAYLIFAVALIVFGAWQASQGDWGIFIASVLGALVQLLAAGNVPNAPPVEDVHTPEHGELH
jgi:hypothetical protein